VSDWFASAVSGSGCAAAARAVDWASTPLGEPVGWPAALRRAVEICFSTRFAVLVTWGPQLTMIYNDGYREMLGSDLHPRAMGASAPQLWGEIWHDIGPLFAHVMETGEPTWDVDMLLWMSRSGFLEETRFTFSYSALRDDDGTVCGVMDIATETTDQVVDRRRLSTLSTLADALHRQPDEARDMARVAVDVLAPSEDVTAVHYYRGDCLTASTGELSPVTMDVIEAARRSGRTCWQDGVLVAAVGDGRDAGPVDVLVLRGNPHRPYDESQRNFLGLAVGTISTALAQESAQRRRVERARTISDVLQDAMVPSVPRSARWGTRYRPADDDLAVGGDWFDVVELPDGTSGLVVGDCVGHGVDAAARMGRLSSAGRAVMLDGAGPARTLERLDAFARTVPGAEITTVYCGVVDARSGTLVYSSAGHPPALLVHADGTTSWLDEAGGLPLALVAGSRPEYKVSLSPGDTVVLYTDGLVERRGESLRAGLRRLAEVAPAACAGSNLDDVTERLLDALVADGARDDVAIVVYRAG
jgi:hypothetical protein